jgi:hypothetical protein
MLIVGTRGRSLGGFQGLVGNRNSFSKWCLQYSPIPVVVVRPTEKRIKKKKKRDADPARQDYARILRESGVEEHETANSSKNSTFEAPNDPATEAHAVAAALGLPARFDPTLTPYVVEVSRPLKTNSRKSEAGTGSVNGSVNGSVDDLSPGDSRSLSPTTARKGSKTSERTESPIMSGEESSEGEEDDDDEGEFEVVSGHALLDNDVDENLKKKQKLHDMEMLEAAALAAGRKGSVGSGDSSNSGSGSGSGTAEGAGDEEEEEE